MIKETNSISILRKVVKSNVPGFDDPEVGKNEWIKLYDFTCVDWSFGNTVRNYDLERIERYNNTTNPQYIDCSFSTTSQELQPPYDVHTGDYIVYTQGTTTFFWRIVKINQAQMFKNCSVFELIGEMIQPKENDINLESGVIKSINLAETEGMEI